MRDLSASTSIAGRRETSTAVFGAVDDDDGDDGDVLLQLLGPIKTPPTRVTCRSNSHLLLGISPTLHNCPQDNWPESLKASDLSQCSTIPQLRNWPSVSFRNRPIRGLPGAC